MLATLSRNWWTVVVRGLLAVAFGVFAWVRPDLFWASLVLVFAVYAVVDGVFALLAALSGAGGDRWPHLIEGILGIALGVLAFVYPGQTGAAIVLVIGIWAVTTGILEVLSAVRLRREIEEEWLLGAGGLLSIVFGAIILARPQFGEVATTYALGTYGIVFGLILIVLGIRLRSFKGSPVAARAR
jgi:uncharacterized membrane protein HdeD (DUF308 family)